MPDQFILSEKVRRPAATGLIRARLLQPLVADGGPSVALVIAPAGSGKTTLLAQAAAATHLPVGWYRVTADDYREAAFVGHLAKAILDMSPTPSAALSGRGADLPADLGELLGRVDGGDTPALLVIDDLHEVAGTEAEALFAQFLDLRPRGLRVLIGTRRPPEINLPRLRVSGQLREISGDDLRFRSWEVEELFTVVHDEPLAPESAAALTRRTAGWAAALQLFHFATTGKGVAARRRAVGELGAQSRLIRTYLASNVLAGLPADRRLFMLRTCALGTMTGANCDALLSTSGSAEILEDLEGQQLFTTSTDDGVSFRYHEVLQRHLELALVAEYGDAEARTWYLRSAAVLEQAGAVRDAVRAYARAEDWASVARLLQRNDPGAAVAVSREPAEFLPRRLLEQDPWLALADARRRVRIGDLTGAVAAFAHAEHLLDDSEFRQRCRRESAAVRTWLPGAGVPPLGEGMGVRRPLTERLRTVTRRGPAPTRGDLGGLTPTEPDLAAAVTSLLAGDFAAAGRLANAQAVDEAVNPWERLAAQLVAVVADVVTGRAVNAGELFEDVVLAGDLDGLPWLARLARGVMTATLAATDPAPWRWAAADDLRIECERTGDEWGAALVQLATAVAAELAAHDSAGDRYRDVAGRFERLDAPVLRAWAEVLLCCYDARRGGAVDAGLVRQMEARARILRLPGVYAACQSLLADGGPVELATILNLTRPLPPPPLLAAAHPAGGSARDDVVAADRAANVHLVCFGGFRIVVDGSEIDLDPLRPRARSLLRLMAVRPGQSLHREWLIETLWPGADLPTGTRRLQVAISSIRQHLQNLADGSAPSIRRNQDAYTLDVPADTDVDVVEFERLVHVAAAATAGGDLDESIAARSAALALYQGDLLPEEGPAEYIVAERDRLRLRAAAVAADLARDCVRAERLDDALSAAQRSVQLDQYSDLAWQTLTDLHAAAGDHTAAARTRLTHERIRRELDEYVG